MPITYRVVADSAEELAEPLRKGAKQVDGKWVVDALPEGYGLEDVRGLKSTVQALRSEVKEHGEKVRAFLDAGLTPEEAKAAADALSKMKAGQLKSSADIDAWKQTVESKFSEEQKKLNERLARRTDRLRNELVRGKLAPIVAAKGGSEAMDAILTLAERHIRVEEDGEGNLVPVVVGSDGKTAALTKKAGSMDPMGFDELIDEMARAPSTKGLFRALAAGGAGSTSQTGGAGRMANPGLPQSARELFDRANTA